MPIYIFDANEYTPFHEVYDLCVQLERAKGDAECEEPLRRALRAALHTLSARLREDGVKAPCARWTTPMSGTSTQGGGTSPVAWPTNAGGSAA